MLVYVCGPFELLGGGGMAGQLEEGRGGHWLDSGGGGIGWTAAK